MKLKKYLIILGASLLVLPACKPTEKNYRSAYDIAIAKKAAEADDLAQEGLISSDAPTMRVIEGDTLYFKSAPLLFENSDAKRFPYSLVVDEFKMPTNARSSAAVIREKGFDAEVAKSTGGRWFVIAGGTETLEEARQLTKRFRNAFPSYAYIGISKPILIRR